MAVNGRSVGGLRKLVPRASLTDGKLDILIVPAAGWPETLRLLLRILTGEKANAEKIIEFQASELIVLTDRPIHSDLDGESGPESTWHIKTGPKITVLC